MYKKYFLNRLLTNKDLTTKIKIYFSTKSIGDDFDPYEANYIYSNLNPLTIKAYVRELSPEALVWKQYGLKEMGAKEIICEEKYAGWFRKASKIEIDNDIYEVYKEGVGNRAIIQKRPYKLIRILLQKK